MGQNLRTNVMDEFCREKGSCFYVAIILDNGLMITRLDGTNSTSEDHTCGGLKKLNLGEYFTSMQFPHSFIQELTRASIDHVISDVSTSVQTKEPKRVSKALNDPAWVEAMQEELLQFKLQNVWVLVDLPKGYRAFGTKWVYRNKKDERGIVVRNKARLVAQGHTQEEDEFYSPTPRNLPSFWDSAGPTEKERILYPVKLNLSMMGFFDVSYRSRQISMFAVCARAGFRSLVILRILPLEFRCLLLISDLLELHLIRSQ
ncbi:putative ribonuclease H-like domain-containing protein [Tanacetum coccineum]